MVTRRKPFVGVALSAESVWLLQQQEGNQRLMRMMAFQTGIGSNRAMNEDRARGKLSMTFSA